MPKPSWMDHRLPFKDSPSVTGTFAVFYLPSWAVVVVAGKLFAISTISRTCRASQSEVFRLPEMENAEKWAARNGRCNISIKYIYAK